MSLEFSELKRKRPIALQLAPMIDIFVLIIVFLLMSTVLGQVSVVFPSGMKSAKSISKESVEAAPEVVIHDQKVVISILNREFPIDFFMRPMNQKALDELKAQVGEYIKNVSNQNKGSVVNVNIVAGAETPYKYIFNVVRVLRLAGFQSVLFIAEGEAQ